MIASKMFSQHVHLQPYPSQHDRPVGRLKKKKLNDNRKETNEKETPANGRTRRYEILCANNTVELWQFRIRIFFFLLLWAESKKRRRRWIHVFAVSPISKYESSSSCPCPMQCNALPRNSTLAHVSMSVCNASPFTLAPLPAMRALRSRAFRIFIYQKYDSFAALMEIIIFIVIDIMKNPQNINRPHSVERVRSTPFFLFHFVNELCCACFRFDFLHKRLVRSDAALIELNKPNND